MSPPEVDDFENRLLARVVACRKKLHRRQRKFGYWKAANFWVGALSAIVSALVGVAILNEWIGRNAAGALALTAAVLTAVIAVFDLGGRTVRTGVERANWQQLLDDYEDLANHRGVDGAVGRFNELNAEYSRLMRADAEARRPP